LGSLFEILARTPRILHRDATRYIFVKIDWTMTVALAPHNNQTEPNRRTIVLLFTILMERYRNFVRNDKTIVTNDRNKDGIVLNENMKKKWLFHYIITLMAD